MPFQPFVGFTMRFITFDAAYLPGSENITKKVSFSMNIEHVSLVLPLEGDISGAQTAIYVDGQVVHVAQPLVKVVQLLNGVVPV